MSESPETGDESSEQGRRILLAIVNGDSGSRIQRWREQHDRAQALRYPPHVTLCYDVPPDAPPGALEAQVRHAFDVPAAVRLGGPRIFENPGRTMYVEVQQTRQLDRARERLNDGAYVSLPAREHWTWHVTCLRRTVDVSPAIIEAARVDLCIDAGWRIEEIACLELRDAGYQRLATWLV